MRSNTTRNIRRGLKAFGLLLIIVVSLPSLYAFHARKTYGDVWAQLGISEKDATENIRQSFLDGWLQFYSARNLHNIATGDRKAIALDLLEYTKKVVQTDEFKKKYELQRQSRKPVEPRKPKTEKEIRDEQIKSLQGSMDNLTKAMKDAKDDMKKIYQSSYDQLKAQVDEYAKPDNDMIKYIAQSEQQQYENATKEYAESLKKWEQTYPANSNLFVKARLQQVLANTSDVDYNAELVEKWGKKRFVNPAYEKKSSNWKLAFRAGKDVTEAVRVSVQKWANEL